MRKTILIITDNEYTQINGVVTTFKNIEKYATGDGYNIVYLDPGQFTNISAFGYPEVKLSFPWKINEKIEKISPDYIHIATEGPIGLCAKIYCDYKGYRYNTSYHTNFPDFLKKIYKIPRSLTWLYLRWFHGKSRTVLTTTNSMVVELKNKKFKNNIKPWTRGVDFSYLTPSVVVPVRKENAIPNLLYVGRVSKEKNIDAVCDLSPQYNVTIVGDGPCIAQLKSKYPKVNFLGYKTGQELANCYAMADVFVFPSKVDTFGIVIIEAISLGTPVAAYPVTGPIDIITEQNGYLSHDLSHAVEKCLSLNRSTVKQSSQIWTWDKSWRIFKENLVEII